MRKVLLECKNCKGQDKIDMAILKGIGYFWQCSKCSKAQYYKPIPGPDKRRRLCYPIACRKGE